LVAAGDNGRYRTTYGNNSFGWAKYQCHFTADFGASAAADKGLAAPAAHNTDVDENTASTLLMTRNGGMLTLSEEFPDNVGDAPLPRICPHGGDFREPFFHTGLRADDARRLKPDE
jgi:hypothetical protein